MWVATYLVIVTNFLFYTILVFLNIFMCRPREKIWNPLITGSCYDWNATNLSAGIFNSISDFAILLLPVRSIWKLQIPLKKRLGISIVFATGIV